MGKRERINVGEKGRKIDRRKEERQRGFRAELEVEERAVDLMLRVF